MNLFVISISAVFIIAGLFGFDFPNQFQYFASFILMGILGLSHGSIDHIIASDFVKLTKNKAAFIFVYIVIIGLYVLVWYYMPLLSFLFFLLYSSFHFGQADTEKVSVALSGFIKPLFQLSYGVIVITSFALFNVSYAESIYPEWFQEIIQPESLHKYFKFALITSSVLYAVVTAKLLLFNSNQKYEILSITFKIFIVTLIFYSLPPLLGFSLYFGLWHSLFVLDKEYKEALKLKVVNGLKSFLGKLIPFTVISLLGMTLIIFIGENSAHFYTLIAISVIAFPHTLLMHLFYSKE
jgi:Brp/Blh family beta-carotene 15,15'-monooxygenase